LSGRLEIGNSGIGTDQGGLAMRRLPIILAAGLSLGLWFCTPVDAQQAGPPAYNLNRFYYYPYYFFPHNYWPTMSPRWPEPPGMPYMRPPAYMAYPAFHEPNWRFENWSPQKYYRGFHFWLDQF
jgi:hypothetical protein